MTSDKKRDVCLRIGQFYLSRHDGNHSEAAKGIQSLALVDVQIYGMTLVIKLARPGLLIGRKGSNLFGLQEYLRKSEGIRSDLIIHVEEVEDINSLVIYYPYEGY